LTLNNIAVIAMLRYGLDSRHKGMCSTTEVFILNREYKELTHFVESPRLIAHYLYS